MEKYENLNRGANVVDENLDSCCAAGCEGLWPEIELAVVILRMKLIRMYAVGRTPACQSLITFPSRYEHQTDMSKAPLVSRLT